MNGYCPSTGIFAQSPAKENMLRTRSRPFSSPRYFCIANFSRAFVVITSSKVGTFDSRTRYSGNRMIVFAGFVGTFGEESEPGAEKGTASANGSNFGVD